MHKDHEVPAANFCATLAANVDNTKLSDAEFREFVRNSLPGVEGANYPPSGRE